MGMIFIPCYKGINLLCYPLVNSTSSRLSFSSYWQTKLLKAPHLYESSSYHQENLSLISCYGICRVQPQARRIRLSRGYVERSQGTGPYPCQIVAAVISLFPIPVKFVIWNVLASKFFIYWSLFPCELVYNKVWIFLPLLNVHMDARIRGLVCVCKCKRERERDKGSVCLSNFVCN